MDVTGAHPATYDDMDVFFFSSLLAAQYFRMRSEIALVDGFVAGALDAARLRDGAGAISMPNISDRSSPASTFAPAGPLRVFERSDPAFAINSC